MTQLAAEENSRTPFDQFVKLGFPTRKNEEWKYTRIAGLFNQEYSLIPGSETNDLSPNDLDIFRLPGHEQASELVFVNGYYSSSLSNIRSASLSVISLGD